MKLLADTQILLHATGQPDKLSLVARALINDPANEILFSAASMWEIIIKSALGRDDFRVEPRVLRRALLDHGYIELPITGEHALMVENLPPLHKDPFDRMLLAQATIEGVLLITSDELLASYPGPVRKV